MRVTLYFAVLCLTPTIAFTASARPGIDGIADRYVELTLSGLLLQAEEVKVDVLLDDELRQARSARRTVAEINREARTILSLLDAQPPADDPIARMRSRSLRARISALEIGTRAKGVAIPLYEEIEGRFGFKPQFRPLTDYDPAVAELESEMPGTGSLADRINAMRKAASVPPEKVEAVFQAALAECRRRTKAHIPMGSETLEVRFTDDDVTPAMALYEGDAKTVISISKKIPTDVDRLLQHACHEAYPGHHAHYVTMDRELFRKRGWSEYGVGIDSDPLVPVAEAIAEHGVSVAFPVDERIAFERDVLYPILGRKMQNEDQWRVFLNARPTLLGSTATIARDFIEHRIDEEATVQRLIRYRFQTPEAARQTVKMLKAFGTYLIASDFGWYAVDRTMKTRNMGEQWRLIERMQREPMLLPDILAL